MSVTKRELLSTRHDEPLHACKATTWTNSCHACWSKMATCMKTNNRACQLGPPSQCDLIDKELVRFNCNKSRPKKGGGGECNISVRHGQWKTGTDKATLWCLWCKGKTHSNQTMARSSSNYSLDGVRFYVKLHPTLGARGMHTAMIVAIERSFCTGISNSRTSSSQTSGEDDVSSNVMDDGLPPIKSTSKSTN